MTPSRLPFFLFIFYLFALSLSAQAAISSAPLEAIGMYHVPPSEYALVKDLGVDTVQISVESSSTDAEALDHLASAQSLGLKVIFGIYKWPFDSLEILPVVEKFHDVEAISYWYVIDEPDLHNVEPDIVAQLTNFIHTVDAKKRPAYITVSDISSQKQWVDKKLVKKKSYDRYMDSADIVGVLRYDQPKKLKKYLEEHVFDRFRDRRWWAVVSLNQTPKHLKQSVELFMQGKPAGIFYYAFADEGWNFFLKNEPALMQTLQEINYTLRGRPWTKPKKGGAMVLTTPQSEPKHAQPGWATAVSSAGFVLPSGATSAAVNDFFSWPGGSSATANFAPPQTPVFSPQTQTASPPPAQQQQQQREQMQMQQRQVRQAQEKQAQQQQSAPESPQASTQDPAIESQKHDEEQRRREEMERQMQQQKYQKPKYKTSPF